MRFRARLTFLYKTHPIQTCAESLQSRRPLCGIGRSGAASGTFLGNIMRIALTAALMIVATIAFADEPSSPKAEETATSATQPTEATAEKSATSAPAAETTAMAVQEDNKPFKPPTGYRPKRVNGDQVYCTKIVVLGSRFPKEDCRTEAQLRDIEAQKASMRGEMDQRNHQCTSAAGCAVN